MVVNLSFLDQKNQQKMKLNGIYRLLVSAAPADNLMCEDRNKKTNSVAFSRQANYTDRNATRQRAHGILD
jgi:hypothetical protein